MEGSCRVVKDLLLPEEMGGGVGSNIEDTGHKRGGLFSLGFPVRLHIHNDAGRCASQSCGEIRGVP